MLAKDIYGIGFTTADQIAQNVGIPRDSPNRARAGIDHVLLEATSDGHCALPLPKLKLTAVKLLEVGEADDRTSIVADAHQRLPAVWRTSTANR